MAASTSYYYYYLTTTATTAEDRNVGINRVPMRMRLVTDTSINHRNKSSRHRLKLQTVATASSAGGEGEGEGEGGRSSPVHQLLFSVTPPNNSEIDYLGQSTKGDLNINFGPYLPPSPFILTSLPLLLYVVHSFFFFSITNLLPKFWGLSCRNSQ